MDNIVSALQSRPKSPTRLNRNSKIFKVIIETIAEKKGEAVVSLDLRKIDEAVSDFFILTQAQSSTQIKGIADAIAFEVKEATGERPYHRHDGAEWTLIDYVNVVVHIFTPDYRQFYDIEGLWADADRKEHIDTAERSE